MELEHLQEQETRPHSTIIHFAKAVAPAQKVYSCLFKRKRKFNQNDFVHLAWVYIEDRVSQRGQGWLEKLSSLPIH
jgi:hypothetical protein